MLMPGRLFTLEITASAVAWYAAIVATVSAAVELGNYFRERVNVRVSFQRNMEMVNDLQHAGMILTLVAVVNTGRRTVTITCVGIEYLKGGGAVLFDIVPPLPRLLAEGQQLMAFADEKNLRFTEVKSFIAADASGCKFHAHFAPLHRRIWWAMRRLKSARTLPAS